MTVKIIAVPRASTLIYGIAKGASRNKIWLLPANVCPVVPLALVEAGVKFKFIDINPQTLCLDMNELKQKVVEYGLTNIAGVIYIRTYGFAPTANQDLANLRDLLGKDIILVDDQCLSTPIVDWSETQAFGADLVLFSTGYSKVIDLGFGGYGVFFNDLAYEPPSIEHDPEAYDALTKLYKAAINKVDPIFANLDSNEFSSDWVPKDVGLSWNDLKEKIISKSPKVLSHKRAINKIYNESLCNFNPLNDGYQGWRFNIRVKNPRTVLSSLFEAGLFASDHYYPSSNLWGNNLAVNSLALHKSVINLFNDENYSIHKAKRTVDIIQKTAIKDQ